MPVVCLFCKESFKNNEDWGFFTPDVEEWKLLTEEHKGIFSVINKATIHKKCYDDFIYNPSIKKDSVLGEEKIEPKKKAEE